MPILEATDLTMSFGGETILEGVSFHVDKGEKIGVVGVNGAGKTTLLEILAGDLEPDRGSVFVSQDTTLGYLRQHDAFDDSATLGDEVQKIYKEYERMESELSELSQRIADGEAGGSPAGEKLLARYGDLQEKFSEEGGFSYKSEMRGILSSMAFTEDDLDKRIGSFSGGERTRLALACLLMEKPDLLLLDEPTNHLDIGMLKWLEQYLRNYRGAVMIVSHDRYFLDQMAARIFDVENKKLKSYSGNYTLFAEKKRKEREADLRAYNKQQDEIRRQEEIIRKFKERGTEHLAKRAASREKALEHMELIEKPDAGPGTISITFRERYKTGNDVFLAEGLSKEFPGRTLFKDADFDIKRGERICVVGRNGIGKTTLLRILLGEEEPTSGYIKRGVNLDIGYYDQRQESLDPGKTVMDEIHDTFRLYKDSEIRAFLGRFLFRGERVFSMVGDLSGGEKARLALLKLMMAGTNVLLLDEPTNHLDIESKEVFEEALSAYPGTIIAVSHDRYFLNRIAGRIFELGEDGITVFQGGYDYYEEKKQEISSANGYIKELRANGSRVKPVEAPGGAAADHSREAGPKGEEGSSGDIRPGSAEERRLKKEQEAEERRKKRRKEALEKEIGSLEKKIEDLQAEMCGEEVLSDHEKLAELDGKLREAQEALDDAFDEWADM